MAAIHPNEFGVQEFSDEQGMYQVWLVILTDADYDLAILDKSCHSITEQEAKEIADAIDPDVDEPEEITNVAIVQRLTIKAMQGKEFTQEEEDALDPDKKGKGINKRKAFLDKHEIKW